MRTWYEEMKVEVVIMGLMVFSSTAESREVSTYLAVAFVRLTLDINLKLKSAAVLKLYQDCLIIK